MSPNDKLMRCPFCGEDDLLPMMVSDTPVWEVHCGGDCPVNPTAYGKTEDEAINKWNQRYKDSAE